MRIYSADKTFLLMQLLYYHINALNWHSLGIAKLK
nr:MAG TPA: hypothetical protein [Crassvirales sp.]DAU12255.1 MAG TPA: hypothetical protein [Caudoviricetes sp.]